MDESCRKIFSGCLGFYFSGEQKGGKEQIQLDLCTTWSVVSESGVGNMKTGFPKLLLAVLFENTFQCPSVKDTLLNMHVQNCSIIIRKTIKIMRQRKVENNNSRQLM